MDISPIEFLQHATLRTLASLACVLVAGFLAFLGLVGLRFQRRGSARFWATPAAMALCVLPVALGAAFTGLALRGVLEQTAAIELGSGAALAGGSMEALMPLLLSLFVLVLLVGCAFLTTVLGSARTSGLAGNSLTGWALLASVCVTFALTAGLAAVALWLLATVNDGSMPAPSALLAWLNLVTFGSFALALLTLAEAVAGAVAAPRGATGIGIRLASLGALAACGLLAIVGLGMAWSRSSQLTATATGLRDGELPEPVAISEPAVVEPQAPPPPPPAALRSATTKREAGRSIRLSDDGAAVRVGGSIREPRRIRNVTPDYPDIAKQARVQGVVILEATIGPRGNVTSVTVLRGIPLLDASAIEAVKQWVYEPTLLNGVAVPVIMTVTVNYKLS